MKMTQSDYEERKARVESGAADDNDRRLVEHYEREGWTVHNQGSLGITGHAEAEVVKAPAKKTAARPKRGNGTGEQAK